LVILTLTLGLWTLSTSYLLILERIADGERSNPNLSTGLSNARLEPKLSASK
jgi:hypothetical protein